MKNKLTVGAIVFLAGAGALIFGVVRLMGDPIGIGFTLDGAAAVAVSIYVFNYTPKSPS